MRPNCLLLCRLDAPGTLNRRCSDLLYNKIVRPVCQRLGFKVQRADGMINARTIARGIPRSLTDSALVIADVSAGSRAVLRDLEVRRVSRLPTIVLMRGGASVPQTLSTFPAMIYRLDSRSDRLDAQRALFDLIQSTRHGKSFDAAPVIGEIAGTDEDWEQRSTLKNPRKTIAPPRSPRVHRPSRAASRRGGRKTRSSLEAAVAHILRTVENRSLGLEGRIGAQRAKSSREPGGQTKNPRGRMPEGIPIGPDARQTTERRHSRTRPSAVSRKRKAADRAQRIIRVFLASSAELRDDRDGFDLYLRQQNDQLREAGVYLEIVRWENFLDAMSETRLQDEYNEQVRACDIVVCLFFTKAGLFTEEELDHAIEQFKRTGKPRIFTYFKNAPRNTGDIGEEFITVIRLKKKLADLGHFPTSYESCEHLKRHFMDQLKRIIRQNQPSR